ncbi:hypothetical protein [Spirosoma endophyticum]|uniref:Uncharacterized protein n=1 Tax=Spirosoma endophyticum TaxID=662367 RepID=A0A1I1SJN9_9BACT|nr:hypothetical protein [Spirosoma endophyticum]SFD46707.1 hypothetical protein SAMN05216167_105135 [Spirosoma endophyticum]
MNTRFQGDSVAAVKQYVSNARAVLDSLSHFEFLKVRTGQLRTDLHDSQSEKLGLKLQLVRVAVKLDSSGRANGPLKEKLSTTEAKLKGSRAENWVWRSVAVLTLLELATNLINVFK